MTKELFLKNHTIFKEILELKIELKNSTEAVNSRLEKSFSSKLQDRSFEIIQRSEEGGKGERKRNKKKGKEGREKKGW